MIRVRSLSPSLATIEDNLFGIGPALLDAVARSQVSRELASSVRASEAWRDYEATLTQAHTGQAATPAPVIPAEVMPADILARVRRRIVSLGATSSRSIPAPGQIVEITRIVTPRAYQLHGFIQAPLYVALDAASDVEGVWHGWLASGETDYAGWWDFVLQEQDGAVDPDVGMIQVWNPVSLYLPMADRVVAELSPARLQAVRALALAFLTNEPVQQPATPGRVALRSLDGGFRVVTGSPLGEECDPRHRYQHLYFHAAHAVREPARLAAQAAATPSDPVRRLIDQLVRCGEWFGEALSPVPSVSYAMQAARMEDSAVAWADLARLQVVRADDAGGGAIEVSAMGTQPVTCVLRVGGVAEARMVVEPGGEPAVFRWTGSEPAVLFLDCGERAFALPLTL